MDAQQLILPMLCAALATWYLSQRIIQVHGQYRFNFVQGVRIVLVGSASVGHHNLEINNIFSAPARVWVDRPALSGILCFGPVEALLCHGSLPKLAPLVFETGNLPRFFRLIPYGPASIFNVVVQKCILAWGKRVIVGEQNQHNLGGDTSSSLPSAG